MWSCGTCEKQIEDELGVCWNCGTSKDGVPDPEFKHAEPGASDDFTLGDLEEQVAEAFTCTKCAHQEAAIRRVKSRNSDYGVVFDNGPHYMILVICQSCGFSEVYDAAVLGAHSSLETILATLFG